MDDNITELPKRRGRPPRQEQVKTERRRRGKMGPEAQMRMVVPHDWREHWKDYELRWVNDQKGRVRQKTVNDDWDICYSHELPDASPLGEGEKGTPVMTQAAGIGGDGRPYNAYLLRKRKEYFEADKRERQAELDKQEKGLLQYKQGTGDGLDPASDPHTYVPSQS